MQLKKFFKKGYKLYALYVSDSTEEKDLKLEDYQLLQEFVDIFLDEVPRLPPKRDIDFTINLVPGTALVCKAPFRMSTLKLVELKMQLQELMNKKNVRSSVSPWGES